MNSSSRPPDPTGQPPTADNRGDATENFQPTDVLPRQEEDLAFAAELLESEIISDQQMSAALADWSVHGSVPLTVHLKDKGLVLAEQIEKLKQDAKNRVEQARQDRTANRDSTGNGESTLLATLELIDDTGRVAKALGVTPAGPEGDIDVRTVHGRYELIRQIGKGGLGRVWLARDTSLKRFVALKEILPTAATNSSAINRFRNEAEVTGRLDHPSIVPIYQFGEDVESERVFYAMKFLGSSTLQDSLSEYHQRCAEGDENPMLLRQLLTAFVSVCHACSHAHSRNVIHRDLKPANVVIDRFGQVIVIDWGLAKVIDDTSVESLVDAGEVTAGAQTLDGQVLGTPLFMAPEQAAGRLDELDHRTDIYGLGAILFAIVTGQPPHEKTHKKASESGAGPRDVISAIASNPAPSAKNIKDDVDPALDAICRKALANRRYARYQSSEELADDVQRWMAGESVTAYDEPPWQRVKRWIQHHQRLAQSLLVAAIVAIVLLTTLAVSARHEQIAVTHARYLQLIGDVGEVEMHLRDISADIAKNTRFVTALPPVQGILEAQQGNDDPQLATWRERLEVILSAMMRSNTDHLAISYVLKQGEGSREIVRVERNPADPSLVRAVPLSRLRESESDPQMQSVAVLQPGDVRNLVSPPEEFSRSAQEFDRLRVATPVFNEASGECAGMTLIETDISASVINVLREQGTIDGEFFIADGEGNLWVTADPIFGVRRATPGDTIPNIPDDVQAAMSAGKRPFEVRHENSHVARRFYIDKANRGILIFVRIPDGD